MKTPPKTSKIDSKLNSSKGCQLVLWFFIAALLGMFLVLFIKIKYFLAETTTAW